MILKLKADSTNIGNLITYLKTVTLADDDPRKIILIEHLTKQQLRDWTEEFIKMNKDNKAFMDVVIQL